MSAVQFSAAADQAHKEDQTAEHVLQEKKQKYEEIIAMLIEAGYFRAQIQTLSQFDKVVGGLCWYKNFDGHVSKPLALLVLANPIAYS